MQPSPACLARSCAPASRDFLVGPRSDGPHIPPSGRIPGECQFDAATFVINMRVIHELQGRVRAGRRIEDQCIDRRVRRDFPCRRAIVHLVGIEKSDCCVVPGVRAGRHAGGAGRGRASRRSRRLRRRGFHAAGQRQGRNKEQRGHSRKNRGNTHVPGYSTRRTAVNADIPRSAASLSGRKFPAARNSTSRRKAFQPTSPRKPVTWAGIISQK